MKKALAILVLLLPVLALVAACDTQNQEDNAKAGNETRWAPARHAADEDAAPETPPETPVDMGDRVTQAYETGLRQTGDFARQTHEKLGMLAQNPWRGWLIFAFLFGVGAVSLLYGWAIIKSFMVPFAPVWGLLLGAAIVFGLVKTFGDDWSAGTRLMLMAGGGLVGVSLFLFAALRAKPIAALLVVMAPFLMSASFLFDYNAKLGIIIFVLGFVIGFVAMIQVRPMAVVSTSMLGGICFLMCYAIASHLLPGENTEFLTTSFVWLLDNPLMLLVAVAVLTFLGTNFQFGTGPRGTLED